MEEIVGTRGHGDKQHDHQAEYPQGALLVRLRAFILVRQCSLLTEDDKQARETGLHYHRGYIGLFEGREDS
jgi:hypothetical protein